MGIGDKIIFNGFRLNNPLIRAVTVLMNKLSGLIIVHRLDLSFCVFHIWAFNLKILDEHFGGWKEKKGLGDFEFPFFSLVDDVLERWCILTHLT